MKITVGIGEIMKKILFILFFISILSNNSYAFEDTVERYPTGALTDYWTTDYTSYTSPVSIQEFPSATYHCLYFPISYHSVTGTYYTDISSNDYIFTDYLLVTMKQLYGHSYAGVTGTLSLTATIYNTTSGYSQSATLVSVSPIPTSYYQNNSVFEIVDTSGRLYLYKDGVYISDIGATPSTPCKVMIKLSTSDKYVEARCYIDDISTSGSVIGTPETWDEYASNITYSYTIQSYQSYPTSTFQTELYSLTNTQNIGLVDTQLLDNASGNMAYARLSTVGDYYGLYMLELMRDSDVLTDLYFYYEQSSDPHGLPEVLFLAETDTAAEIRDEDNNGGIISGGSSVYLYPDEKEDGYYNLTIDFSEPSYSRRVELTKIYNTTTLNGSIFSYSGLTENYNVSRDNTLIDHTNGSDSWDNTVTWIGQDSYIYEFEPDLSIPGFWGYVKNSETQTAIKSATVSITNGTDTFYIYTDENGMYYLTNGIANGSTYTVQAKKTNYESSNPYNLTTTAGATTRQDLYLSKASGSGIYYAPHDVGFTVLEYWYSGAGLPGVSYTISSEDDGELKTGTTDSKGMFTGSDMTGGTNYTITLTYNGKTYTEYVEPSLTEYTFVLNKEGVLHQYANSWLTLSYTENTNNVTIAYESNKTITGASLTAIANNGTTVYTQTLTADTGSFTFETGGEGDYTLNFHIQATDGDTASQSWGLSYPDKVPLFPDSYPAWLKNVLFSGIVIVFLLSFGKAKNDIACGAVAILTSMGYLFEWFTCSFYFVVLVWIIALGAAFIHYKRTGGIG